LHLAGGKSKKASSERGKPGLVGVVLCQIGAAVMALKGVDYEEILEHYYPGTTIEHFYE